MITVAADGKKNVSGYGSDIFTYSSENAMTGSVVGGTSTNLTFDPLLRLYQSGSGGVTSRFAYDGLDALAEYDGADALQRRWVYDPTTGQPVVWYEGSGTAAADRRYLSADERGSVISVSDSSGAALGISSYDEYGNPGASNLGRFGYTGQAWLAGAKLWYLNARMYSPAIGGRFMQPDPVGYAGGINLYAYTGNDPVNFVDPLGLSDRGLPPGSQCTGSRICGDRVGLAVGSSGLSEPGPASGGLKSGPLGGCDQSTPSNIVVCGTLPSPNPSTGSPLFGATFIGLSAPSCEPCNAILTGGLGAELVITGRRGAGEAPFYFNGIAWVPDLYYVKPWYSDAFDACFALCPPLLAAGGAIYVTGYEIALGTGVRIALAGNRRGIGWPHYHRRGPGGIGRHRPWEAKPADKSYWDRF